MSNNHQYQEKDFEKEHATPVIKTTSKDLKPPAARKIPSTSKSKRKAKAPDAPKRPLSAYNLFFREERVRWLKERQGGNGKEKSRALFALMGKEIGARWKQLTPEEIARYQRMAEVHHQRFLREKEEFVAEKKRKASTELRHDAGWSDSISGLQSLEETLTANQALQAAALLQDQQSRALDEFRRSQYCASITGAAPNSFPFATNTLRDKSRQNQNPQNLQPSISPAGFPESSLTGLTSLQLAAMFQQNSFGMHTTSSSSLRELMTQHPQNRFSGSGLESTLFPFYEQTATTGRSGQHERSILAHQLLLARQQDSQMENELIRDNLIRARLLRGAGCLVGENAAESALPSPMLAEIQRQQVSEVARRDPSFLALLGGDGRRGALTLSLCDESHREVAQTLSAASIRQTNEFSLRSQEEGLGRRFVDQLPSLRYPNSFEEVLLHQNNSSLPSLQLHEHEFQMLYPRARNT